MTTEGLLMTLTMQEFNDSAMKKNRILYIQSMPYVLMTESTDVKEEHELTLDGIEEQFYSWSTTGRHDYAL